MKIIYQNRGKNNLGWLVLDFPPGESNPPRYTLSARDYKNKYEGARLFMQGYVSRLSHYSMMQILIYLLIIEKNNP